MKGCSRGALVLLMAAAWPLVVQAQVPAGAEFQVNTYTTGSQNSSRAALSDNGGLVVVWLSARNGYNIMGQRFAAAGQPLGGEFQVNTYTSPLFLDPNVAALPDGGFVVAWLFNGPTSTDSWRVRRYAADGTPTAIETVGTLQRSQSPDVGVDGAGNFVLTWSELTFTTGGRDILAQRFAASGAAIGAEFQVNTYTTFTQRSPAVAGDGAGNFVVVWTSNTQDGSGDGVFGQRFGPNGAPLGSEFRVSSYTTGAQVAADVAAASDGSFVVVWASAGQDGSGYGVFGQRFDAAGTPAGPEFLVNTYTTADQMGPSVAADSSGNFVVAWTSYGQDGSGDGAFAQRYTAAGVPRGGEFRVNTTTAGAQRAGALASDGAGNIAVPMDAPDGSGTGVFAQRYGGLVPAALAVNTFGNGVLEAGEVADVAPSWLNANGAGLTFGGTGASLTGPLPATYAIQTAFANYGFVANGITRRCVDCYRILITAPARPAPHWDATFTERLTSDTLGQHKAWLLHLGDSFSDVPRTSGFYRFVETLFHHSITGGCATGQYCPAASTTRAAMAVFVLAAKEGDGYAPPACAPPNTFDDVPETSPFCRWIEELARRGVVAGCGGGFYCPDDPVTREQMAVFALRTQDPGPPPPPCQPPNLYLDVPETSTFCPWIEELTRRGVVAGCGGGNYCPTAPVPREQVAVFIAGAFGLTLYGP